MDHNEFEECNVCGEQHDTSQCPLLEMAKKVKDEQIPSRARLTLPLNLQLMYHEKKNFFILAKESIASGTQFGPVEAPRVNSLIKTSRFPLKIFFKDNTFEYLNTDDENVCNWMCFIAPAENIDEQNLIAYQLSQDIYFSAQRNIEAEEELKVGYSSPYGKKMASLEVFRARETNSEPVKHKESKVLKIQDESNQSRLESTLPVVDNIHNSELEKPVVPKRRPGRPRKVCHVRNVSTAEIQSTEIFNDVVQDTFPPTTHLPNNEDSTAMDVFILKHKSETSPKHSKLTSEFEDSQAIDESVVRSLGAKKLGIKVNQSTWECSVCSKTYADSLIFAKHLQNHYKPSPTSRIRGRAFKRRGWKPSNFDDWRMDNFHKQKRVPTGRPRGRPRKLHGAIKSVMINKYQFTTNIVVDDEKGDKENHSSNKIHVLDNITNEQNSASEVNAKADEQTSMQSPEENSTFHENISLQDLSSYSFEISNIDSSHQLSEKSNENDSCQSKSVGCSTEQNVYSDKRFRPVIRDRSKAVFQKYNLRTTRKAIVFSDEESSENEVEDFEKQSKEEDELFTLENKTVSSEAAESLLEKNFGSQVSTAEDQTECSALISENANVTFTAVDNSVLDTKNDQTVIAVTHAAVVKMTHPKIITLTASSEGDGYQNNFESQVLETSLESSVNCNTPEDMIDKLTERNIASGDISELTTSSNELDNPSSSYSKENKTNALASMINHQKDSVLPFHQYLRRFPRPGKYKCDLCGKGFNKTIYLYRHIRKHTGEFTCCECYRVFARKESMVKHNCSSVIQDKSIENHIGHRCWYCKKTFATEQLLKKHTAKHVEKYKCSDCDKSYSTKDILLNHSCSQKAASEKFECVVCKKTFTKYNYLVKHIPIHTGQHACEICGKWLRSVDSLANHLRMCGQVKEIEINGQAECPNCHEMFTDVAKFRKHQFEHTHIHSCETCGARFRNLMSLGIHVCQGKNITHEMCNKSFSGAVNMQQNKLNQSEAYFKCTECKKEFLLKEDMEQHLCIKVKQSRENDKHISVGVKQNSDIFVQTKLNLKPLVCEICGSTFSSTSSLNVHKNLHGEKKFGCDECGKRFHRKDLLLEHHAVHGDPTFPCTTCKKLFKTKKSLDVHVMLHDGIKRFKCATCGKEFFQKGNLLKHEETHNKGRKYICSFCHKSFSTKEYLRVHILEHTWGKIYSCGICKRSFVKEHQLRSHHKMFHSNQTYVCKYCGISLKLRHSLKRHLKKKHSEQENEWKDADVVNNMLITKETSPTTTSVNDIMKTLKEESENRALTSKVTQPTEIQLQVPDLSTKGAEMLLAVAGIDSEELRQALVSGRAHIKQGTDPNTIEISVPVAYEEANQGVVQANTFQEDQIVTLINSEESNVNDNPVEINIVEDGTVIQEEINIIQEEASHNSVHPEENSEIAETLSGTYHLEYPSNNATIAHDSEQQIISEHVITSRDEESMETIIPDQVSTQIEETQQIVITDQNLPEVTHHIYFDTSELHHIANDGKDGIPEGALLLEDGTIIHQGKHDGNSDLLLYVLTTNN